MGTDAAPFKKSPALIMLLVPANAFCCVNCNQELQAAIKSSWQENSLAIALPFIALSLIIMILSWLALRKNNVMLYEPAEMPLLCASLVLGMGLGGFVDGIVFHQILQWHEMLSNRIPADNLLGKSVNMFWDGIFHLFTLLTVLIGIFLIWKVLKTPQNKSSRYVFGAGLLAGWGIFNVIEGVISHEVFGLHNVREAANEKEFWNLAFHILGISLIAAGVFLYYKGRKREKII